jgi:hypothetical protein
MKDVGSGKPIPLEDKAEDEEETKPTTLDQRDQGSDHVAA